MSESKELTELTEKMFAIAINSLHESRKMLLSFAGAMKVIRDQKLYQQRQYDSFDAFCVSPEISLNPKTVEMYISLYSYWIEDKKKKMDEMAGIEMNKLVLLRKVAKPEKYFHDAKTLSFNEFRKVIQKEEFKLDPEEEETSEYSKKHHDCPFHIDGNCSQGVAIESLLEDNNPKKKNKDSGLL
jgi:hypothetical protein